MLSLWFSVSVGVGACAGSARDDAALATNTAQSVLTAVDDVWTPIVQTEIQRARLLDDAGYRQHMEPWILANEAIEQARRATQLLNLAVHTWDAQSDAGAMFREIVPCVLEDLKLVRALMAGKPDVPQQLPQALTLIELGLAALGKPGATCKPKVIVLPTPLTPLLPAQPSAALVAP